MKKYYIKMLIRREGKSNLNKLSNNINKDYEVTSSNTSLS